MSKTAYHKQKSLDTRHDKDIQDAQKKVQLAEEELAKAMQEKLKATKDRDAAVTTLVKIKGDVAKKQLGLEMTIKKKDEQLLHLKKQLAETTEQLKYATIERKAVEQSFSKEVHDLRAGNTKAVEMLLSYHEENESLRSAFGVIGLSPPLGSSSPTSTPTAVKNQSQLLSPSEAEFVLQASKDSTVLINGS